MKVGEFISDDLDILFKKEQRFANQFEYYCKEHNKIFSTQICLTAANPVLFILQIIIKNGNNGEIKSS
jgi:hypothetical protein